MNRPTTSSLLKIVVGSFGSLVFSASGASAQILTEYDVVTYTDNPSNIPFTDTFSLPKFNVSDGTLTNVSITLSAATSGEVDVFNNTPLTQTYTNASATIPVEVTGPGNTSLSLLLTETGVSGTVAAFSLASTPIAPVTGSDPVSLTNNLGLWEGSAGQTIQLSLSFAGNGTYGGTGPLQVFFGGNAVGSATTTITYTYTTNGEVVPEPETFSLMAVALGFLALGGYVRRKRRAE